MGLPTSPTDMAYDQKRYQREWVRKRRALMRDRPREERMKREGKCPLTELLLTSKFHEGCECLSTEEHRQTNGQVAP